jgi:hypothetical protein
MKAILRIVALILLAVGIMLPMAGCSVKEKHYHSGPAPKHYRSAPAPKKHYKPAPRRSAPKRGSSKAAAGLKRG